MIRLTALNPNEHAIFSYKTLKTEVTDITETSIFQNNAPPRQGHSSAKHIPAFLHLII